jgi:hypothetical protein
MQEELERQKAALLEKTKPKETVEVSGNQFPLNSHENYLIDDLKQMKKVVKLVEHK